VELAVAMEKELLYNPRDAFLKRDTERRVELAVAMEKDLLYNPRDAFVQAASHHTCVTMTQRNVNTLTSKRPGGRFP
jgi:hypothetical protein